MKIDIKYSGIYVGQITAQESREGFEIIGAECVTDMFSFKKRANMRPEIEETMVDIRIEMEDEENDKSLYEERHDSLYRFIGILAEEHVVFDQFIITCNKLRNSKHSYHILASIIDMGGYNVNIHNLKKDCEATGMIFLKFLGFNEESVTITGKDSELKIEIPSILSPQNNYGGSNPLCHELVLPYREIVLKSLERELYGSARTNHKRLY